jgi:hypothetical protein
MYTTPFTQIFDLDRRLQCIVLEHLLLLHCARFQISRKHSAYAAAMNSFVSGRTDRS